MSAELPPTDHTVPPAGLNVGEAHRVMQAHMDCPITVCPIKLYAKTLLVITSAREQTFRATLDSADILDTLLDGAEDGDDHHDFMGDVLRPFLLSAI
ncbi:hypothetical protein IU447_13670 [Nocardia farcinica]|uniref:hypothetical protein n=1 Tax=Nocardia farcinica TaxID=37329 RepID=UPI0018961626|nr:hypothetical protein [Nocardia farcinica]MBF6361162.1 hypothetical protein [Nocardia farcinica]